MVLQKINNLRKNESGFTIVELLIVIVIIGILAAITIVAYNGVTTKANDAAARSNAESIQKVVEAYNADNGSYPTFAQLIGYNGSTRVPSALDNGGASATASSGALTSGAGLVDGTSTTFCAGNTATTTTCLGAANGAKDIIYVANSGNTGACIGWYDYSGAAGTAGKTSWVYAGAATAPGGGASGAALTCS